MSKVVFRAETSDGRACLQVTDNEGKLTLAHHYVVAGETLEGQGAQILTTKWARADVAKRAHIERTYRGVDFSAVKIDLLG